MDLYTSTHYEGKIKTKELTNTIILFRPRKLKCDLPKERNVHTSVLLITHISMFKSKRVEECERNWVRIELYFF